jgi:hypothetical protein
MHGDQEFSKMAGSRSAYGSESEWVSSLGLVELASQLTELAELIRRDLLSKKKKKLKLPCYLGGAYVRFPRIFVS